MRRGSHHVYHTGKDDIATGISSSDKENFRPETSDRFTDSDLDKSSEDSNTNYGRGTRKEEIEEDGGWNEYPIDGDEREGLSERIARIVWDDKTLCSVAG